jgi:transcriptional regulator GlxA family with amidase domain
VFLPRAGVRGRVRLLVGVSPKRYITRTRLAHAATLLHKTDAPLAEVAPSSRSANLQAHLRRGTRRISR